MKRMFPLVALFLFQVALSGGTSSEVSRGCLADDGNISLGTLSTHYGMPAAFVGGTYRICARLRDVNPVPAQRWPGLEKGLHTMGLSDGNHSLDDVGLGETVFTCPASKAETFQKQKDSWVRIEFTLRHRTLRDFEGYEGPLFEARVQRVSPAGLYLPHRDPLPEKGARLKIHATKLEKSVGPGKPSPGTTLVRASYGGTNKAMLEVGADQIDILARHRCGVLNIEVSEAPGKPKYPRLKGRLIDFEVQVPFHKAGSALLFHRYRTPGFHQLYGRFSAHDLKEKQRFHEAILKSLEGRFRLPARTFDFRESKSISHVVSDRGSTLNSGDFAVWFFRVQGDGHQKVVSEFGSLHPDRGKDVLDKLEKVPGHYRRRAFFMGKNSAVGVIYTDGTQGLGSQIYGHPVIESLRWDAPSGTWMSDSPDALKEKAKALMERIVTLSEELRRSRDESDGPERELRRAEMDLEMAERRRDAEKNGPLLPPIPGEKKSPAQMKRERLKELDKEIRELKAEVTKLRKPVEAAGKDSAKQKQTLEDLRDDLVALWSGISP